MQGVGLCSGMLAWVPGYAAAGVIALLSPLYLAVLPILAPVSHLFTSCGEITNHPQDTPRRHSPMSLGKMRDMATPAHDRVCQIGLPCCTCMAASSVHDDVRRLSDSVACISCRL